MIEMMIRQGSLLSIISYILSYLRTLLSYLRTRVRAHYLILHPAATVSLRARREAAATGKKACRSAPSARPLARPLSASSGWLRSKWTLLSSGSAA